MRFPASHATHQHHHAAMAPCRRRHSQRRVPQEALTAARAAAPALAYVPRAATATSTRSHCIPATSSAAGCGACLAAAVGSIRATTATVEGRGNLLKAPPFHGLAVSLGPATGLTAPVGSPANAPNGDQCMPPCGTAPQKPRPLSAIASVQPVDASWMTSPACKRPQRPDFGLGPAGKPVQGRLCSWLGLTGREGLGKPPCPHISTPA